MLLIKFIAVLLAAIAISKSYIDYRKKQEPRIMFLFWTTVWLAAAVILVYPLLIEKVITATKDNSISIGTITGVALVFMLFIVYRVYAKVARLEYQLTQLVRSSALNQGLKDKEL